MRVTINRMGYLVITAETEMEGYALHHWTQENITIRVADPQAKAVIPTGPAIIIETKVEKDES